MPKYEVKIEDATVETVETVEAETVGQFGDFVSFSNGKDENTEVIAFFPISDVKSIKKVVEAPVEVATKKPRKKRNLTDEARKAISDAQKKRWAVKKAASAAQTV